MKTAFRCAVLAAGFVLAACGGNDPTPAPAAPMAANQGEAVETVGDITLRANALQTSVLNEAVAHEYGIARSDKSVMLLVGLRQGAGADEISLPSKVTVRVSGLGGASREIEMREQRTGDLVDYVGTVEISLPETLRFDITATFGHGGTAKAQFSREFYPR